VKRRQIGRPSSARAGDEWFVPAVVQLLEGHQTHAPLGKTSNCSGDEPAHSRRARTFRPMCFHGGVGGRKEFWSRRTFGALVDHGPEWGMTEHRRVGHRLRASGGTKDQFSRKSEAILLGVRNAPTHQRPRFEKTRGLRDPGSWTAGSLREYLGLCRLRAEYGRGENRFRARGGRASPRRALGKTRVI